MTFEIAMDSTADAFGIGVVNKIIMIPDESVPPNSFLRPGSAFK